MLSIIYSSLNEFIYIIFNLLLVKFIYKNNLDKLYFNLYNKNFYLFKIYIILIQFCILIYGVAFILFNLLLNCLLLIYLFN